MQYRSLLRRYAPWPRELRVSLGQAGQQAFMGRIIYYIVYRGFAGIMENKMETTKYNGAL